MRKRVWGTMIAAVAALLMISAGAARADLSVSIDQSSGSTLYSLPGLPDGAPAYPVPTSVTGAASFDGTDGTSVVVQYMQKAPDGAEIVIYSGEASVSCRETGCAWSHRIPFVIGPGDYTITAIASQPNAVDPNVADTVTASITATIL